MSKISEQKALEAYPFEPIECGGGIVDSNSEYRGLYQEGYDQAMKDFLEKAEKVLTERMYFSDDEAKEFKNYMKKEA